MGSSPCSRVSSHDPIDVFFKNIDGGPLPVPGSIGAGTQVAALVHPDVNPPGAVGSAGVFQDLSDITVGLLFSTKQGAPVSASIPMDFRQRKIMAECPSVWMQGIISTPSA